MSGGSFGVVNSLHELPGYDLKDGARATAYGMTCVGVCSEIRMDSCLFGNTALTDRQGL
jgi:hypothetical protein